MENSSLEPNALGVDTERGRSAVVIVLLAALLTLALAELGLSLFHPIYYRRPVDRKRVSAKELLHQPASVPGLDYELKPGLDVEHGITRVRTNSHGLRDDPIAQKTAGMRRIAVVGDSVTFGLGVENGETFCDVLERCLDADGSRAGRRVEVLNYGVSAYSIRDEARVIEGKILALEPDLVIVAYALNDPDVEPVQALQHFFAPTLWWEHFELLRLIAWKKRIWDMHRYGGYDVFRYLHAEDGPQWRNVPRYFADIRRSTHEHGIETLVVVLPVFFGYKREKSTAPDPRAVSTHWTSWNDYPYVGLHEQVAAAARAAGLFACDLLPPLRETGLDPGEFEGDTGHPNAAGHEWIGRVLCDRIRGGEQLLFPTSR